MKKLTPVRRKVVSLSQEELVRADCLTDRGFLPLLIQPAIEGVSLVEWAAAHREVLNAHLDKHGGVLFRDFQLGSTVEFEQFIAAISQAWAEYREPATPRTQVSEHIHTSTEYPPDRPIFLHNENSHCESWPLRIYFLCVSPPTHGGETPIADCRRIYSRLLPETIRRFGEKKIMYVRNFGDGLGFSWQTVFRTTERAGVEAYCRQAGMTTEWKGGDRLRITYVRDAVAEHPRTQEPIWFNHGTFFHSSTLDPATRQILLRELPESEWPYNTYYGDGSPIEPEVLDELRAAYREETVTFEWKQGDLLMLDNMLVAHGRAPFTGPRRILVGMSDPYGSR